jgi:excisionase family DNA binding protein
VTVVRLLSRAEAAQLLGVSVSTVSRMSRDGRLHAILYDGYRYYYGAEELTAIMTAAQREEQRAARSKITWVARQRELYSGLDQIVFGPPPG